MATWPVLVEDWQHECCGEPFGLADTVEWALVLNAGQHVDWGWPDDMLVKLTPIYRRSAQSDQGAVMDIIGTSDGPEVAVYTPLDHEGKILRGSLAEDHHGGVPEELKETAGVVRRLRIVSQRFRLAEHAWRPIPGAVRFRETEYMPSSFAGEDRRGPEAWIDLGALVDLELRDVAT